MARSRAKAALCARCPGSARDGRRQPLPGRAKHLQTPRFRNSAPDDLRLTWPVVRLAGFSDYDRLAAGIPVRDIRGMKIGRRSFAPRAAAKDPDVQVLYGSDGTRTRDLRRDRPVLVSPGWAGVGGDFRHEQAFSAVVLRGLPGVGGGLRRPPAGCVRDALLSELQPAVCLAGCGRRLSDTNHSDPNGKWRSEEFLRMRRGSAHRLGARLKEPLRGLATPVRLQRCWRRTRSVPRSRARIRRTRAAQRTPRGSAPGR